MSAFNQESLLHVYVMTEANELLLMLNTCWHSQGEAPSSHPRFVDCICIWANALVSTTEMSPIWLATQVIPPSLLTFFL